MPEAGSDLGRFPIFCLGKTTICRHIRMMKSPCIKTCQIDRQSGLCLGCLRTLDEIASWARYSDGERSDIVADLGNRRLPGSAQGGRE